MSIVPNFDVYNSAGNTLVYSIPLVQAHNGPKESKKTVTITNFNASTEINLLGGTKPWDWIVKFYIVGDDYEDVESKLDALNSNVVSNTPYFLRIDKTISTYYEYKFKRFLDFEWSDSLRNGNEAILVTGTFRIGAW